MLTQLLPGFMPELTAIEARTYNLVNKSTGNVLSEGMTELNKQNLLWLPAMCLLAAKTAKHTDVKVIRLAGVMHILGLASHLHWSLPEDAELIKMKQGMQHRILVGDLLYSQVYADIYQYGLQQYLMPLTALIGSIHEELLQKGVKYKPNLPGQPHDTPDIKIFAMMSEKACYIGAYATAGSSFPTDEMSKIGYHLGLLKAAAQLGASISGYLSNWYACWELSGCLPEEKTRQHCQHILHCLGKQWGLEKPVLLCS